MVRFFINQWRKKKESWQQLAATCRYSLGLEGIFNPSVYNFFLIILYLFFGKPNWFFLKLLMNNLTKIPVFYASDWADRFRSLSFCQFIHSLYVSLSPLTSHWFVSSMNVIFPIGFRFWTIMILYLICLNNNIRGGDAIMKNRKSAIFFCVFQNLTREPFFFALLSKFLGVTFFLRSRV